jgi:hypothetical protein
LVDNQLKSDEDRDDQETHGECAGCEKSSNDISGTVKPSSSVQQTDAGVETGERQTTSDGYLTKVASGYLSTCCSNKEAADWVKCRCTMFDMFDYKLLLRKYEYL